MGSRVLSPAFIVSASLLVLAVFALDPVVNALTQYYAKESIDIRRTLSAFDVSSLPSFRPDPRAKRYVASPKELGTDEWMSMAFREVAAGPEEPPAVLFVTYYSDPYDRIPHTPEVCYEQHGSLVTGTRSIELPLPTLRPAGPPAEARLVEMRQGDYELVLVYVFCCNGELYNDRRRVRWIMGLPGDKYTYFSKIEVVSPLLEGSDPDAVIDRCKRLLAEPPPPLLNEHFPPETDLKRR
jgi:hypothetical protein